MGRAKLKMEMISKEKLRNITFKKRKEGLIRKMHEFTTLCDVDACMIVYGPKQENGAVEPEIWPQNHDEVQRIVDIYKLKKKDSGNKSFGLNDFFHERKRKIEDELSKLRQRNMESKYRTRPELLDYMNEGQLREFASGLKHKSDLVRSKIEEMRRSSSKQQIMDTKTGVNSQFYPHRPPVNDMHIPIPIFYPTIDHHQQVHSVNHNSTMMLLMNGEDQFGGASSSNGANFQFASFKQQIFYEASMGQNRGAPPLPRYYAPPLPLPLSLPTPPYVVAPPQLPFWENQDEAKYQMKNHGE